MNISFIIGIFVLGTILGSFYNVVAYRITKGESIIYPPSHCPICNHRLKPWELIPMVSYFLQMGKCSSCKSKISIFYPISEMLCGLLFVFCYISFGVSLDLIIALTFISMLIIVILSDIYYMIIEDSVLIFFSILLMIEIYFFNGFQSLSNSLAEAVISFLIMFGLKLFGDFIFKKESMGGGDIKLMAVFGLVVGWKLSVITIFLSAFIALPISIFILKTGKNHEIPYGPFLSIAVIIIYLTNFYF